jgi:hypothetical protein
VSEHYEETTGADGQKVMKIKDGHEAQVKAALKKIVDDLLGKDGLDAVVYGLHMPGHEEEAENSKVLRGTHIKIGTNEYFDWTSYNAQDADKSDKKYESKFYFGNSGGEYNSANDTLNYEDGIEYLNNLQWNNLILSNYNDETEGPHLTFMQALGEMIEQTHQGTRTSTESGQYGVFTNLATERYHDGTSDKFECTKELPEINETIKTHKPSFGGSIFAGYGNRSGNIYYGIEIGGGYSHLKTKLKSENKTKPMNTTEFANGEIQYINKDEVIKNPATGQDLGPVYDSTTGKGKPVYVSGMGRQSGAIPLELPDYSNHYEITLKKSINFSVTPMIGIVCSNTVYFVSLGLTYSRYAINIKPNGELLDNYSNAVPVPYIKGYLDSLKGDSYLHEYKTRMTASGLVDVDDNLSEATQKSEKLNAIYPSAVIETNSNGEKNTFSGIRITYPHYDDGGVYVEGEDSDHPWMDSELSSKALSTKKVKKFRFVIEPGIGVRTFLDHGYFVGLHYSCQLGTNKTISYNEFGAFPAHIGRSNMKYKLKISGHKIKIDFGKAFNSI